MSGIGKSIDSIMPTGNSAIDGIIGGTAWYGTITYAFPFDFDAYGDYPNADGLASESEGFAPFSASARNAAITMLTQSGAGGAFSVAGLTNANIQSGSVNHATIRFGYTAMEADGLVYYGYSWLPEEDGLWGSYYAARSGDVWLNPRFSQHLEPGNRAWYVTMHEIGHALGLKHPHEDRPKMPGHYDNMSNTVMSYSAYSGARDSFSDSSIDYPQSYMRSDIAALQHMYGADYSTNAGDTVYRWQPGNGNTLINGKVAIAPQDNTIFLTIWDGNGNDTYNLSAYRSDLVVNLGAGQSSHFGSGQHANLGNGRVAGGMVFNAYLHEDDPRSLIENVIGGNGRDRITGNMAENDLRGRNNADLLAGLNGADTLRGGDGSDTLRGGDGDDLLFGNGGADHLHGGRGADMISFLTSGAGVTVNLQLGRGNGGEAAGDRYVAIEHITGSTWGDVLTGNAFANEMAGHRRQDVLSGLGGQDTLSGGLGADIFVFGKGRTHQDIITDFGLAGADDQIRLTGFGGYASFDQLREHMLQVGRDVYIGDGDGDMIVVENTQLADLGRDVFLFA